MSDIVKIKHCGSAVEGQMLVNRLSHAGVAAYIQETVPKVRSRAFSGEMNTLQGVDVYVGVRDQARAEELLEQWEGIAFDEEGISKEAETAEIAEDVREYLERQEAAQTSGRINRLIWGGNKKGQVRLMAAAVIIVLAGVILLGFIT